ncbi:helix-turn-helix domain-containing protein [Sulfitobacter geojensis]|uniref:Helix-turn-helix transcriptional regulator n=1 Tax=Sulfitobacter geojensis TaxID=1342299 RepID=A0AAE2VXK5_9RHOB|nr:helix-turn-helix transcriptional regulator [Sulfitobacter geojensis]MBM1693282.1 helix-turn-helix transcriptional regulator [Sulfitobacter geojensis]MBM1705448.1 helix-turn-helix transcriptional regulator [Sulfitobacter geojensis]MBM1709506.1 helix-turn-helix transcriptional regulator [Sulfitobacter geojensis]MBM1713571.1 helix-turn-helix transcriptional regulator [Sulfitobacter geojensis]
MMENTDAILSLLPTRLKDARRAKGLSLDAVAKLSGVSRSMVSQIERGESSPTISTLWNLTKALQVDFAGLLEDDLESRIEVLRSGNVPAIEKLGAGYSIRILSPPEEAGRHEVYDLRFQENGVLDSLPHATGAREHLTVINGHLTVTSGDAVEQLAEGDTARYAADVAHRITADGPARAFLVVHGA